MNIITIKPEDINLYWVGTEREGNPMFSQDPSDSLIVSCEAAAIKIANIFESLNSNVL